MTKAVAACAAAAQLAPAAAGPGASDAVADTLVAGTTAFGAIGTAIIAVAIYLVALMLQSRVGKGAPRRHLIPIAPPTTDDNLARYLSRTSSYDQAMTAAMIPAPEV